MLVWIDFGLRNFFWIVVFVFFIDSKRSFKLKYKRFILDLVKCFVSKERIGKYFCYRYGSLFYFEI